MSLLQPYSAFEDLYRPFEGLFNANLPTNASDQNRWLPAVDIKSSELGFVLEMEVPGFLPDEVEGDKRDQQYMGVQGRVYGVAEQVGKRQSVYAEEGNQKGAQYDNSRTTHFDIALH